MEWGCSSVRKHPPSMYKALTWTSNTLEMFHCELFSCVNQKELHTPVFHVSLDWIPFSYAWLSFLFCSSKHLSEQNSWFMLSRDYIRWLAWTQMLRTAGNQWWPLLDRHTSPHPTPPIQQQLWSSRAAWQKQWRVYFTEVSETGKYLRKASLLRYEETSSDMDYRHRSLSLSAP